MRMSKYPNLKDIEYLLNRLPESDKLEVLRHAGRTVLYQATFRNHYEVIKTILSSLWCSHRLELLMTDDWTPLHSAAQSSHSESVKSILDSLSAFEQLKLLAVKFSGYTESTALTLASGETSELLLRYKKNAQRSGELKT